MRTCGGMTGSGFSFARPTTRRCRRPCYDVLHTFSKEYIVDDLTESLREKGVIIHPRRHGRVVEGEYSLRPASAPAPIPTKTTTWR